MTERPTEGNAYQDVGRRQDDRRSPRRRETDSMSRSTSKRNQAMERLDEAEESDSNREVGTSVQMYHMDMPGLHRTN